jgi:hypothetical protein
VIRQSFSCLPRLPYLSAPSLCRTSTVDVHVYRTFAVRCTLVVQEKKRLERARLERLADSDASGSGEGSEYYGSDHETRGKSTETAEQELERKVVEMEVSSRFNFVPKSYRKSCDVMKYFLSCHYATCHEVYTSGDLSTTAATTRHVGQVRRRRSRSWSARSLRWRWVHAQLSMLCRNCI